MENPYRALAWLASIALVCGLFVAFKVSTPASNSSLLFQGPSLIGMRGFAPTFFSVLTGTWFMELIRVSNVLTDGAIVLGIVTAWVDRHRGWLAALLVVTVLTWLWPAAVQAWQVALFVPQAAADGLTPQTIAIVNSTLFAVPLIPVVMSLTFALTHRRLIPSSVTTSTDAELGIVRSSL